MKSRFDYNVVARRSDEFHVIAQAERRIIDEDDKLDRIADRYAAEYDGYGTADSPDVADEPTRTAYLVLDQDGKHLETYIEGERYPKDKMMVAARQVAFVSSGVVLEVPVLYDYRPGQRV